MGYFGGLQFFHRILASGTEVNFSTYTILLKNLLAAGNWRKYVEVTSMMNLCLVKSLIRILLSDGIPEIIFFGQADQRLPIC